MAQCEICPAHTRARAICGFQLAITGALSLGFFVCYGTTRIESSWAWRIPFMLSIAVATFVAVMVSAPHDRTEAPPHSSRAYTC